MKRLICLLLIIGFTLNISGCAALKKKFTRKKKPKPKKISFYQIKKYDIKPSMELYEKHFMFWVNWHKGLLEKLGESHKYDLQCINGIISNLEDMYNLLVDEEKKELADHIQVLKQAEKIIAEDTLTNFNIVRVRRILEREIRTIKNRFSPRKMAGKIRKEW